MLVFAALDYDQNGPNGESDRAAAKRKLRKLPEPEKREPEVLPLVTAIALQVPKVEEAMALLREDKPGHAIVVVYVSPLSVQRSTVGAACLARTDKRHHPSAVVVLPNMPLDAHGKVDLKRLQPPSPNDWLPAVKLRMQREKLNPEDDTPPDATTVLKGLGEPRAHAEKLAKAPNSGACAVQ